MALRCRERAPSTTSISEVNDSSITLSASESNAGGNGNAERFRGFEIDHEGKLARLLDREIAGLGANKDFATEVPAWRKPVHEVAG
jgi:hypothetical protein